MEYLLGRLLHTHQNEYEILLVYTGATHVDSKLYEKLTIGDYAKDGGEELFTKMHCVRIVNL